MSQIKLRGWVMEKKEEVGFLYKKKTKKKERKETVDENSVTHCSIKLVMFENEYSNKLKFRSHLKIAEKRRRGEGGKKEKQNYS